jgi:hypothetical protein
MYSFMYQKKVCKDVSCRWKNWFDCSETHFFDFPIFRHLACLMKVVQETHRARWIWCGRFLYITIFVVVLSLLVFAFLPTDQLYNIPFVLLIYVFSLSQLFFSCCKCRPWYEHVNNGHLGTIYRKFCLSPTFVSLILLKTILDMIDLFIL